jgi:hypothetical protein
MFLTTATKPKISVIGARHIHRVLHSPPTKGTKMASIEATHAAFANKRDASYENLLEVMNDDTLSAGEKSKALLDAQADLGVTDGAQNLMANVYKRWAQTGA